MSTEFTENVDVVIIGSGPTGAAYARTIADESPQTRVLLVEAGPVVADPPGLHMANFTDDAERERAQIASQGPYQYAYPQRGSSEDPRERAEALIRRPGLFAVGTGSIDGDGMAAAQETSCVGGMGSHWFAACPRPSDAERIGFIDRAVLDAAYDTAEGYLQVADDQFADSAFAAHVVGLLGPVLDPGRADDRRVRAMPMAVRWTPDGINRSGPNVIFDRLRPGRDGAFELRAETLCEQVLLEDGVAVGVQLLDRRSGRRTRVGARAVVVAADALRTPQLLFASGLRLPALGRYLNEHPQVSVMAEVHGVRIDHHGRETGDTSTMASSAALSVASSGVTWLPYSPEFPFHGMLDQIDSTSLPPREGRADASVPLISVHFFLPQEPRVENGLEFSETETDWIGMPAMRIHSTLSQTDQALVERAKSEALRLSGVLGRVLPGDEPWFLPLGSSLHYQGTVRMGAVDDGTSVCDPSSRVWGTSNLFVAGNGVIPTMTACNPTLTSVALSVIAARELLRQLGRSRTPERVG